MSPETRRILDAWLKTTRRLGAFLENAALLEGRKLSQMTDEELANACEDYIKWLEGYNSGPLRWTLRT